MDIILEGKLMEERKSEADDGRSAKEEEIIDWKRKRSYSNSKVVWMNRVIICMQIQEKEQQED